MTAGQCTATFGTDRCRLAVGHRGQHKGPGDVIRWGGGRYSQASLSGKPGAMRDAAKDQAARRRRPRGQRCSVCCEESETLVDGRCPDRAACELRCVPLF